MKQLKVDDLQDGDLLFISDISDLSKAIKGIEQNSCFSHVGICFDKMLYHADFTEGVIKQSVSSYLENKNKKIVVYRYPEIDVEKVKKEAEKYLGLPYNYSFYPDGKGFYCSQYIAKILPVFSTIPMKFGDDKKEISDYWENYYRKLNLPVPLNLEGTNPYQLSQSELLQVIGKLN